MKYDQIPVTIDSGKEQLFHYELVENGQYGQYCRITSEGKELIIDEDLAYIKGDMPEHWQQPAIAKLLELLEEDNS